MSITDRAGALERVLRETKNESPIVQEAAVIAVAESPAGPAKAADAVTKVLAASSGASATVKRDAVTALTSEGLPPPKDATGLWWALVVGLLSLLVVTLVGLLWTILDGDSKTSADKVLIVFTPLLTGLLGLFAPSPRELSGTAGTAKP